jgi:hypothetical protein
VLIKVLVPAAHQATALRVLDGGDGQLREEQAVPVALLATFLQPPPPPWGGP